MHFVAYTAYVWWFLSHFMPWSAFCIKIASKWTSDPKMACWSLICGWKIAHTTSISSHMFMKARKRDMNTSVSLVRLFQHYLSTNIWPNAYMCKYGVFAQKQAIISRVPPENYLCVLNMCQLLHTTVWSSFELVETYLKKLLVQFSVILVIFQLGDSKYRFWPHIFTKNEIFHFCLVIRCNVQKYIAWPIFSFQTRCFAFFKWFLILFRALFSAFTLIAWFSAKNASQTCRNEFGS